MFLITILILLGQQLSSLVECFPIHPAFRIGGGAPRPTTTRTRDTTRIAVPLVRRQRGGGKCEIRERACQVGIGMWFSQLTATVLDSFNAEHRSLAEQQLELPRPTRALLSPSFLPSVPASPETPIQGTTNTITPLVSARRRPSRSSKTTRNSSPSSTTTTASSSSANSSSSSSQEAPLPPPRRRRRRHPPRSGRPDWDTMMLRLEAFYKEHGHSWVGPIPPVALVQRSHATRKTKNCMDGQYPGYRPLHQQDHMDLYQWTLSIRRNYRHQIQQGPSRPEYYYFTKISNRGMDKKQNEQMKKTTATMKKREATDDKNNRPSNALSMQHMFTTTSTNTAAERQQHQQSTSKLQVVRSTQQGELYHDQNFNYGDASSSTSTTASYDYEDSHRKNRQRQQPRPQLSIDKLKQLQAVQFHWDVQTWRWQQRYHELLAFYQYYGHCRVPLVTNSCHDLLVQSTTSTTATIHDHSMMDQTFNRTTSLSASTQQPPFIPHGLGVWVRNQRREYRRLCEGLPSTLTSSRLQALEQIDFEWYKSRNDTWQQRYEELVQYQQQYGHVHVPENGIPCTTTSPTNMSNRNDGITSQPIKNLYFCLGQWCMNQRSSYKRYSQGLNSAMTLERIALLEKIGFIWDRKQYKWDHMLERLKSYYRQYGHVNIDTNDSMNRDLRIWLIRQRFQYHQRHQQEQEGHEDQGQPHSYNTSTTHGSMKQHQQQQERRQLSKDRMEAIENNIPNFAWKIRGGMNGPSLEDWTNLFHAMRQKGIRPDSRPKQHWFDGINPLSMQVKDCWTEQDLLELWNQEQDDE